MRRWMMRVISFSYLRKSKTIGRTGRIFQEKKARSGMIIERSGIRSQLEDGR